jgi:uncharacterized membrane protein required for colicin V production
MGWFDLIVLLFLIGAVLQGYRRGLVLQAASLVCYAVSIWLAYLFADDLAPVVAEEWPLPKTGQTALLTFLKVDKLLYTVLAFFVLMIGIRLVLSLVVTLINQVTKLPVVSTLNRSGGVLFAVAKLTVITVVIVHMLTVLPWATGQTAMKESVVAQACIQMTPTLTEELTSWLKR